MLRPLEQFVCDTCSQVIEKPEDGYLEWVSDRDSSKTSEFNIIHAKWTSPLQTADGCSQHERRYGRADMHLNDYVGLKANRHLLYFLDEGPLIRETFTEPRVESIREWVELFKRLTIPYYEEARLYFEQAIAEGVFDDPGNPPTYTSEFYLKAAIERYSRF